MKIDCGAIALKIRIEIKASAAPHKLTVHGIVPNKLSFSRCAKYELIALCVFCMNSSALVLHKHLHHKQRKLLVRIYKS